MIGAVLLANRKATTQFIADDPIEVVLFRQARGRTSDGGTRKDGPKEPIAPQVMRLIPASGPSSDVRLTSGSLAQASYVLMGEWDCDMEREDTFSFDGVDYTISGPVEPQHTNNAYQKKGPVTRNG